MVMNSSHALKAISCNAFIITASIVFLTSLCSFGADLPGPVASKPVAPETLAEVRSLYSSHATEARKKYEADIQRWPNEYTGELKKLEDAFTKEGNLNGVLAAQSEIKRFKEEKTIGADALVSEPEGLAEVQKKYRTMCEEAEDQRDKRMEQLSKIYVSWLKEIRKKLTRDKKIEEALKIDAELQRVEEGGDPADAAEKGETELAEKAFFVLANDLEGARKIYGDKVAESTGLAGQGLKKWPAEYEAALQKMEDDLTKDGDLNGVVAVQDEAKRFNLNGTLDDGTVVSEPEKLAELQQKFVTVRGEAISKHEERVERLKQAYVGRLKEIQKKLTIEKKLSDAINVDNEIKRIGEVIASTGSQPASGSSTSATTGRSKGLILHYSFDKDEGDKVADTSGRGNHGRSNGARWVQNARDNGAFEFRGNNSYIDVSLQNCDISTDALTVNLWFKGDGPQVEPNPITCFYGDPTSGMALYAHLTTGATGSRDHAIAIGNWVNYVDSSPANVWEDNRWHMLTLVRKPLDVSAYLDQKLVAKQSPPRTITKSILRFSGFQSYHGFAGRMDEVSVFNKALSASEVSALFKTQVGRLSSPITAKAGLSLAAIQTPQPSRSSGSTRRGSEPSVASPRPKSLPKLTLSSGEGTKYTVASLYRKIAPSVVVVSAGGGSGSGFCVGRGDILMSNAHVVQSADRVTVTTFAYNKNELVKQNVISASVIYVNAAEDIAILQMDKGDRGLTPIPVAKKNPAAGEKICALGSPGLGGQILTQSITEGIISAGAREFGGQSWLQHTAAVNPGNSGGPLLNEMGEVVGMNTLKAFLEGVSFAIPAEKVREVFSR